MIYFRAGIRTDSKSESESKWVVDRVGAKKSEFRFQNLNGIKKTLNIRGLFALKSESESDFRPR
jgi:hypothetical protein